MNPSLTDQLVEEILRRLQKKVLLLLTRGDGYRDEIFTRLRAMENVAFTVAAADDVHDADRWATLGGLRPLDEFAAPQSMAPYHTLLLPFLDVVTVAELADARPLSTVSRVTHHALLAGKAVLALPYHCDPGSELNRVRGLGKNPAYAARIQAHLAALAGCGVSLCDLDDAERQLSGIHATPPVATATTTAHYLTLRDVMADQRLAQTPGARLTDAALDYLKQNRPLPLTRSPQEQ